MGANLGPGRSNLEKFNMESEHLCACASFRGGGLVRGSGWGQRTSQSGSGFRILVEERTRTLTLTSRWTNSACDLETNVSGFDASTKL